MLNGAFDFDIRKFPKIIVRVDIQDIVKEVGSKMDKDFLQVVISSHL